MRYFGVSGHHFGGLALLFDVSFLSLSVVNQKSCKSLVYEGCITHFATFMVAEGRLCGMESGFVACSFLECVGLTMCKCSDLCFGSHWVASGSVFG